MAASVPLASREVRWFFEGGVDRHTALEKWFTSCSPFPKRSDCGAPAWGKRVDGQPDVYLLVPRGDDIGIKWREGQLQVKGRVGLVGTQVFCGRHQGTVDRWMKWSYSSSGAAKPRPGDGAPPVPDELARFQRIFAEGSELPVASVRKERMLRKLRLDTMTGAVEEVGAKAFIDRGANAELADIVVDGTAYCSLAFEAFPDDSAMDAAFTSAVEGFLALLVSPLLDAAHSRSYAAFLAEIAGRHASSNG